MLIAAIILGLLALFCGVAAIANSDNFEGWGAGFLFLGFLWMIAFFGALNMRISSQELTGYIYSSSNRTGYTTAHIRFSQNAGTDAQPEFCVKTDSEPGRAIQKYVGTDTKVKISIPGYFYFSNNPFACGTTKTVIQEVK
jgi:hypothetical protein